jgi:putative redox protein
MTIAKITDSHYNLALNNGRHNFNADEPKNKGGTDMAPAPDELLEASLASCTAITLRMYADRKQWDLNAVDVSVNIARVESKTIFTRVIKLYGNLQEEQRERLLQIAKACPVSKSLLGEIEINSNLE